MILNGSFNSRNDVVENHKFKYQPQQNKQQLLGTKLIITGLLPSQRYLSNIENAHDKDSHTKIIVQHSVRRTVARVCNLNLLFRTHIINRKWTQQSKSMCAVQLYDLLHSVLRVCANGKVDSHTFTLLTRRMQYGSWEDYINARH